MLRILLLFALAAPMWGAEPALAELKSLSEYAVLHDAAVKGNSIGRLNRGAKVTLYQSQDDMSLVLVEAWAPKFAFTKIPSLLARVKLLSVAGDAELRSDAGGGRSLGRISKDAKPEMKDVKGKWVKINVGGWIPSSALTEAPDEVSVKVRLTTSEGPIVLSLDPSRAPRTVANFLAYVDQGHYDGTIFHRVIENFMIQGGGFDTSFSQKPTAPPIPLESGNGLKNVRGSVAMARTGDPNSATSQFFINTVDNAFLDKENAQDKFGYAVFGRVTDGMDAVDRIRKMPTGPGPGLPSDVPQTMVVITKASKE